MDTVKTKLREEATCSICLEFFINPVLLECGHNFCHGCISKCWLEFPSDTACPQCRNPIVPKNCRANRALANVVEILKQLSNQEEEESGRKVCRKHPEPSELVFCKEDQVSLCLVCEGPEQHKHHHVAPLKEAAQEYKDCFRGYIKAIQKEKREILMHRINAIQESEELMKCTETEKQKTLREFEHLRQFLAERESFLVTKIQGVTRDLVNQRNEQLSEFSVELFILHNIARQLEDKCKQPDNKVLQDVEKTLEKFEKRPKFQPPEAIPHELKWRVWELCELNVLLEGAAKHFRNTLQDGFQQQKATVTLDPDSAHPQVLLSRDGKSLRWTEMAQDVSETPKRFDRHFCIVGHQEFTAGRHFWDVAVGDKESWAVGVASSSVDRKGFPPLTIEEGFFAIGRPPRQCRPPSVPEENEEIKKIRVSLNCAGRQVVFYDVERAKKVYSFSHAPFHRDALQPFFWLRGEAQLSLCTN